MIKQNLKCACGHNRSSKLVRATALFLLLFVRVGQAQDTARLEHQRQMFLEAETALKQGQRPRYVELLARLQDYPLYPYLRYEDIRQRLDRTPTEEFDTFLKNYADTPLAPRLRRRWLQSLAKHAQWRTYLHAYSSPGNMRTDCNYRLALLHTGRQHDAFAHMDKIWLSGNTLPDACDPLLAAWNKSGGLTTELAWKRIHAAMDARNPRLAKFLAKYLPASQRHWLDVWYKVYRSPSLILTDSALRDKSKIAHWIVVQGIQRLARADSAEAARIWPQIESRYELAEQERASIERGIALHLAYDGDIQAADWLARVPADSADRTVRFWRIRVALAHQDWHSVLHWIEQLTPNERADVRWQYWRARGLAELGETAQAEITFKSLAKTRSYEGFLSADHLGLPYHFEEKELKFGPAQLARLAALPAIRRARELYALDRMVDARREWRDVTHNFGETQLRLAAKLAQSWGWHDRAILTLGQSQYRDDLQLRFPIVHENIVFKQSDQAGINPAWALAVMRRESAFDPKARSNRGAMGLMQLLPRTARRVARNLKLRLRHSAQLFEADMNIRMGIAYLRMQLNRFGDQPVLATAAYNAGGYRVRQWLPEQHSLPADIWIETVPFGETRNYLRSVLAYTAIYEERLGRKPTRLKARMPPIAPTNPPVPVDQSAQGG